MPSLGDAWKKSRTRSRMSTPATTVAQRSPRGAPSPDITSSAAATAGSDHDSGDYSLSSFSDSFSSGVSSSPSPSIIPPCTVVPTDERRRHFPATTAATVAAPTTSAETTAPYRGESPGSPPAVVARNGNDTVGRRMVYPAPTRPISVRAASTGGGGGQTRGRPAAENITDGRHREERTTAPSLPPQAQRSSQPPQGPGPRLNFRRSVSSSLSSPSSSTAPAFLPADLMYVSSMSVMMEDLPPPALPVLQSSSGSEDEGFGSADEEGAFRRLQASAASPIVPPSPRASTGGGDRGASTYDRVLKATAAAAAAAGWRRDRENELRPPQPSAAAGSSNRYVNLKVAAPPPSTAPPPPPPPVPEPRFFKGGQPAGGSGSSAGGDGTAAGSAGGVGIGGISSGGGGSGGGSRGRVWGQKDRGRGLAGAGGGGRPGQLQRSLSTSSRGSSVGTRYFRDPRLETTLALIRSGQSFCAERHITADFVRRANHLGQSTVPETNGETAAQGRAPELIRYALLITEAALYMLEVEMLPRKQQSPSASAIPSPAGSQEGPPAPTQPGANASDHRSSNFLDAGLGSYGKESVTAAVGLVGSGWGSGSGDRPPRSGSSQAGGGGGAVAAGGVTGGDSPVIEEGPRNKAKVKSIETIDRLEAPELVRVLLPFKEVTLRNGDVMAKKGCGIVLHTRVDGRTDHVWLKCRSNQDRGALVDALVRWHESNTPQLPELNVQQVPEATLVAHLSRLAERARSGSIRPKDTDCLIS